MDHFDPYNVFWAIATNIPQRLKTGFVVQGHMFFFYWKQTKVQLIIWQQLQREKEWGMPDLWFSFYITCVSLSPFHTNIQINITDMAHNNLLFRVTSKYITYTRSLLSPLLFLFYHSHSMCEKRPCQRYMVKCCDSCGCGLWQDAESNPARRQCSAQRLIEASVTGRSQKLKRCREQLRTEDMCA